jgi:predicted RNase H-like HicB family nuclease
MFLRNIVIFVKFERMEKYLVVIEKAKNNYSAFSPDVWGCVANGKTVEETVSQFKEALQLHLEAMANDGEDMPRAKGISQHISDGVFRVGEIADEYFITEVEIVVPQHA